MKIVINSLPYSFSRMFKFPITVVSTKKLLNGSYLVLGKDFQGLPFKYKQKIDTRFLLTEWVIEAKHVNEEVHDV